MINVNYQKRKNLELFKSLEDSESLFLSKAQNYIPIYKKFFSLNETNYNGINLNNKWFLSSVKGQIDNDCHLYDCRIKNNLNDKVKDVEMFFKLAPLMDPYKYLIGKYNANDEKLYTLPQFTSTTDECVEKILDSNNSAYVDGLFFFLTSNLIHTHNFFHGVDYYGSFLAIKNDFKMNIYDDIDYLNESTYFNKNKNILFKVDDYEYLFQEENNKLAPITIQHNTSAKSCISFNSIHDEMFDDIF